MSANPESNTPAIVLTQPEIPELAAIGLQLQNLQSIAANLLAQANKAVITSEADFAKGTDLLTLVKTNADETEKLRVAMKRPLDIYIRKLQDTFLPVLDIYTRAKSAMGGKMIAWRNEQDRIAREEQERIRRQNEEAALARAAELEAQGKTAAANAVVEMAAAPLAAPQKTEARRGAYGGKAGTQERWTAEVVNMRDFLKSVLDGSTNFNLDDISVGQMALNKLASNVKVEGTKNGVKIVKVTGLTLRS